MNMKLCTILLIVAVGVTQSQDSTDCTAPTWRSQPGDILVLEGTELVLNWTHPIQPPIDITWDYKGTDSQSTLVLIMDYTTGAGVYIPIQEQWSRRIAHDQSVAGSAIMTLDNVTSADEKYYEVTVKNLDDQRLSLTGRASIDVIHKTDINTAVGIDGEIFQLSLVGNGTEISLPDMMISGRGLTSVMVEVNSAALKPHKIGIQNSVDGAIYNDHSCEHSFKCERQVQLELDPSQTAELIITVVFTVQNLSPITISRAVTWSVPGVTSTSVPNYTRTPDVSAPSTAVDEELYSKSAAKIGLAVGVPMVLIVTATILVLVLYLRRKKTAKPGNGLTFSLETLEDGLKDDSNQIDVTAADLNKYAIKNGLPVAEYMFEFSYDDITSSARTRNEYVACLTALMNTSGGVIKVTSQRGIDVNALISIPSPTIPRQQLKHIKLTSMKPDVAYVMVTKSKDPVTFDYATYTTHRYISEPVRDHQTIKQILSSRGRDLSQITKSSGSDADIQFSDSDESCMKCDDSNPQKLLVMMIALANTPKGGCIKLTGKIGNIPNLEEAVSHVQDTIRLACGDSSSKLIWGSTRGLPKYMYREHWSLKKLDEFIDGNKVAAWGMKVEECCLGAFLRCPACFVISDDGDIQKLNFEAWKSFVTCAADTEPVNLIVQDELAGEEVTSATRQMSRHKTQNGIGDEQQMFSWSESEVWKMEMLPQRDQYTANLKGVINFEMFQLSSHKTCTPREEVLRGIVRRESSELAKVFSGIFQMFEYSWMIAFSSITKAFKHGSKGSVPKTLVMDLLMASEYEGLKLCSVYKPNFDAECNQYSLKAATLLKKYALKHMFRGEKIRHNVKQPIHVKAFAICDTGLQGLEDPDLMHHLQQQFTWRAGKDTNVSQALAQMFLTGDTYVKNSLLADLMQHRMTEEQEKVLFELSRANHALVQGPSGAGKNWIARNFCAAMSQKFGQKSVVYVCSSQVACERMRSEDTCEIHFAKDFETLTRLPDMPKAWNCVVLDDKNNVLYSPLYQWNNFLERLNTKHLVIFFDNIQETKHTKSSTDILTAFLDYCRKSDTTYRSLTMEESHRSCRKVASFIKHICDEQKLVRWLAKKENGLGIDGDDVILHILPAKSERRRDNAVELANYVVDLADRIIVESQSLDGPHIYEPEDVAIVIDTTKVGELFGKNDVQRFISNFENKYPKYRVHMADVSPVKGIIVDTLKNFTGLETKVLIYVIHHGMSHETLDYLSDKRHLIQVVSRALCRVDIVYQGPYGREAVEKLGFGRSPSVPTEDNTDGPREESEATSAADVHQEDFAVTSPLLATPDVEGSSSAYLI